MGSAEGGHPGLFRFVPISPFSSDLFRFGVRSLLSGIPRFVPICSVFFRFVFRTNQNKSGKPLSADPFCKSPISRRSINVKGFGLSPFLPTPFGLHQGWSDSATGSVRREACPSEGVTHLTMAGYGMYCGNILFRC